MGWVLASVLVPALVSGSLWLVQRRLIYFPDRSPVPAAATVLAGARDVVLDTSDGLRLGAWLVPPAGPARDVALAGTVGIAPARMIYFGESLGAAVVTELATRYPPGGLVLRSPFTELAAVGRYHYPILPVRPLLRDRYPVADLIGRITVPAVVVYGTGDRVVPPQQSRAVAARAGGPIRLVAVDGADHNDAALDGAALIEAMVDLADRLTPGA